MKKTQRIKKLLKHLTVSTVMCAVGIILGTLQKPLISAVVLITLLYVAFKSSKKELAHSQALGLTAGFVSYLLINVLSSGEVLLSTMLIKLFTTFLVFLLIIGCSFLYGEGCEDNELSALEISSLYGTVVFVLTYYLGIRFLSLPEGWLRYRTEIPYLFMLIPVMANFHYNIKLILNSKFSEKNIHRVFYSSLMIVFILFTV